ncbi:hypothetical protein DL93DRAFT_2172277 [Clavulina sp. PMI_390]|nr:hypothetical protein DL93DRAFT_2172277 [Clavulina sp. PMI_390]
MFSTSDKWEAFKNHRRAWRTLEPTHSESFVRNTRDVYEASGSTFAWGTGDASRPILNFYQAESNLYNRPARRWDLKEFGLSSFRDFTINEQEDLLILIEEPRTTGAFFMPAPTDDQPTLILHFRSLSTGNPHPLASKPFLSMSGTPLQCQRMNCQVMGNTFGILLSYWEQAPSIMTVWNWVRGCMISHNEFSESAAADSFTFISDHHFLVATHDSLSGYPALDCYDFDVTDTPSNEFGHSTTRALSDATFYFPVPVDEEMMVGIYGFEIESDPPSLSYSPDVSKKASRTSKTSAVRKFHRKDTAPLVVIQFAVAPREGDEEGNDHDYLLIVPAENLLSLVSTGRMDFSWEDWSSDARVTLDGVHAQGANANQNVFSCNVSADRVAVIDWQEQRSATVRVLDFNPVRVQDVARRAHINGNDSGQEIPSPIRVVSGIQRDPHGELELVLTGDDLNNGITYTEMTIPRVFSSFSGIIILEEHFFILCGVGDENLYKIEALTL